MSDVLYPKSHIHFLRSRRHSRSRASTPIQVHVMAISAPCCLSQSFFLVLEYMYLVYALHAGRSAGASNAVASSGSGVTAPHFLPHTTRAQPATLPAYLASRLAQARIFENLIQNLPARTARENFRNLPALAQNFNNFSKFACTLEIRGEKIGKICLRRCQKFACKKFACASKKILA